MPSLAKELKAVLEALAPENIAGGAEARQQLNQLTQTCKCYAALLEIIKDRNGTLIKIRKLAAFALQNKVNFDFSIDDLREEREDFRFTLLHAIATEPDSAILTVLTSVVGAYLERDDDFWPQCWRFVKFASRHDDGKELAYQILAQLTEAWQILSVKERMAQLVDFLVSGLKDESAGVRRNCVACMRVFLPVLTQKNDDSTFTLIPLWIQTASSFVEKDAKVTKQALQTLEQLNSRLELPKDTQCALDRFPLDCLGKADPSLSETISTNVMEIVFRDADKQAERNDDDDDDDDDTMGNDDKEGEEIEPCLHTVVKNLLDVMADSFVRVSYMDVTGATEWGREESFEEPHTTRYGCCCSLLARMTAEVTLDFESVLANVLVPVLHKECQNELKDAAFSCIAIMAEARADSVKEAVGGIVPVATESGSDLSVVCLEKLSQHCLSDVLEYSESILSLAKFALESENEWVQISACGIIVQLCTAMESETIEGHIWPLYEALMLRLNSCSIGHLQEMLLAALSAVATKGSKKFPTVDVGNLFIQKLKSEEHHRLKGRLLVLFGSLAFDKEAFTLFKEDLQRNLQESLASENQTLRKYALVCLGSLAKALGGEVSPLLSAAMRTIIETLVRIENEFFESTLPDRDEDDESPFQEPGFALAEIQEEEEKPDALLEANCCAINVVSTCALHCGDAFSPYAQEALNSLFERARQHWNPDALVAVSEALPSFASFAMNTYEHGEKQWVKGDMSTRLFQGKTTRMLETVWETILHLMKDDAERVTEAALLAGVRVLEIAGPNATNNNQFNFCMNRAAELLHKRVPYANLVDDTTRVDAYLQATGDFVGMVGKTLGASFQSTHHEQLARAFLSLINKGEQEEIVTAFEAWSTVIAELEGTGHELWDEYMKPSVLAGIQHDSLRVKRNTIYTIGVCCEQYQEKLRKDYPKLLELIYEVLTLETSKEDGEDGPSVVVDNAVASLCRMISAAQNHVPLPVAIPRLLSTLPLRQDMEENRAVFECVLKLLEEKQEDMMKNTVALKRVLDTITKDEYEMEDDLKERARQAAKQLRKRKR